MKTAVYALVAIVALGALVGFAAVRSHTPAFVGRWAIARESGRFYLDIRADHTLQASSSDGSVPTWSGRWTQKRDVLDLGFKGDDAGDRVWKVSPDGARLTLKGDHMPAETYDRVP